MALLHARRLFLSQVGQKVFDTSLSSGNAAKARSAQLMSDNITHNLENAHDAICAERAVLGGDGDDALWGDASSLFVGSRMLTFTRLLTSFRPADQPGFSSSAVGSEG